MHKLCATILLLPCVSGTCLGQALSQGSGWHIDAESGVDMDLNTGMVVATNGVVVKYGDAVLRANKATVNQNTGEVVAEGSVGLQAQGQVWLGESLQYNFHTGKIVGQGFRGGNGLYFSKSDAFVGDQKAGVYVGANSMVTSDDYDKPTYRINAKTIVIVPGEYIEAKQATLRLGNSKIPVFYFPYYRASLKGDGPRWEITPGYRTAYGPYLLNTYHWYRSEAFDSSIHLDGRYKRGVGVGPDFQWRSKTWGDGTLKGYYANDLEPGVDSNLKPIDDDRYRIWFAHQANPRTNLTVTAVARYQSDPFVIHDFFEGEYRRNVQPSTFVEANQLWSNYSLDVLAQPQVNDFFETVERLPDIKLTGFRQQIGATPLYYESESSVGYFRRNFASSSTNDLFAAMRADTLHQVVLPYNFFNWLNVEPRVGGRFTHYGEADGRGTTTTDENRGVFNTGMEVNTKASRLWPEVQSRLWQLDGLRHIVQPSINYSFVPNPSVSPRRLPQFDYEIASSRLLPIEFPDYNSIDAIDSQNALRLGLRNKLQTKRKGQLDNVVHWAVYSDYRITRREDQGTFSDVYSDLELKPFSWLLLRSDLRYGTSERRINETISQLAVMPNDIWSASVGHHYLRQDLSRGVLYDDNLLLTTLYYKVNENWGFRASHQYQMRDGTLGGAGVQHLPGFSELDRCANIPGARQPRWPKGLCGGGDFFPQGIPALRRR